MDELELLKKDWQSDTAEYPKVSASEIYPMLLKKSSSIVKWIFYISIIELSLGIVLAVINPSLEHKIEYPTWTNIFIYGSYPVILYFVYRFYLNYKNISVTDNVKLLIGNIIKTRRTVKHYVLFNLIVGGIVAAIGLFLGFINNSGGLEQFNATASTKDYIILIVSIIIGTTIMIGIFLGIYYLLYGLLLKRLNKNYKELKKLEV